MFKERSYKKELLDESTIPKNLLFQNLKELEVINKYLGGHRISLNGIKKAINYLQFSSNKNNLPPLSFGEGSGVRSEGLSIIDIGCGGGDSVNAIAKWARNKKYKITITGIDLKQDCIEYAKKEASPQPSLLRQNLRINSEREKKKERETVTINFKCDDFRNAFSEGSKTDIVHASLFCHHFTENEIVDFIKLCDKKKSIFVINDLERTPIAYYAIKFLTSIFSKSRLVKNDAPLSVLRGFKKTEWRVMLQKAGVKKYLIKNCWAFRHLVIVYPNE